MLRAAVRRHVVRAAVRRASTARRGVSAAAAAAETEPIDPSQPVPDQRAEPYQPPASRPGQQLPWILGSFLAAGMGFYSMQLYMAARKPCQNAAIADLAEQKDVASRYDYTAESFDSEVGMSELLMGVNGLRRRLAGECKGHVLEVSCGTGRNLGYFDVGKEGKVKSVTFIDLSPQMVEVCKKKWNALYGAQKKKDQLRPDLVICFLTASALDAMPLSPAGHKYDTIIQTMGLCSTPAPVPLLENMVRHLDTSNPDARIWLLEHGRSYMPWMNNILDNSAEKHAELHGCWFNREIGQLVADAADRTGMEVVKERRHHFGTTWVFELKPRQETVQAAVTGLPAAADATKGAQDTPQENAAGWWSWLRSR